VGIFGGRSIVITISTPFEWLPEDGEFAAAFAGGKILCRRSNADHVGGHVAAVAGGSKMAITFPEGAVLQYDHERAFTFDRDIHRYTVEALIFVQLDDGGGDIGAEHTIFGKADAGGDKTQLYVGVGALWQELLGRDVQGAVCRENRLFHKELFNARVFVKVEATEVGKMIPSGLNKELVKAIYQGTVVTYIQVGADGFTYQLSFPAGNAEVTGSAAGGGCLFYFFRHATHEIFAISAVADDVLQPAGEFENASL